jgi:hypothetical protein
MLIGLAILVPAIAPCRLVNEFHQQHNSYPGKKYAEMYYRPAQAHLVLNFWD